MYDETLRSFVVRPSVYTNIQRAYQPSVSHMSHFPYNLGNVWNVGGFPKEDKRLGNVWDIGGLPNEDKRLAPSLQSQQPTHLKIPRILKYQLFSPTKPGEEFAGGYNPYRGDFITEYFNSAEQILGLAGCIHENIVANECNKSDERLLRKLEFFLIQHYNSVLQQREKRKNIIKRYGLFRQQATFQWFCSLETLLGKARAKRFVRFCSITKPFELELLTVSLKLVNEKRSEVNKLIFYRTQRGLYTLKDKEVFENEKTKRELAKFDKDMEKVDIRNVFVKPTVRRRTKRIEIYHLPRYRELSTKEVELCCSLALEPSFFLDCKFQLMSDCKKNNGLPLKKARLLLKIDVNKTRKIFDFMLEEGFIWTPETHDAKKKPKQRGRKKTDKSKC